MPTHSLTSVPNLWWCSSLSFLLSFFFFVAAAIEDCSTNPDFAPPPGDPGSDCPLRGERRLGWARRGESSRVESSNFFWSNHRFTHPSLPIALSPHYPPQRALLCSASWGATSGPAHISIYISLYRYNRLLRCLGIGSPSSVPCWRRCHGSSSLTRVSRSESCRRSTRER